MTTLSRRHLLDAVTTSPGNYVRVELTDDAVTVIGADAVVITSTTCRCVNATTPTIVHITVPQKLLAATLKGLNGDEVVVSISPASTKLLLRSGSAHAEVVADGRVPAVQQVPATAWKVVGVEEAVKLRAALQQVAPAMLNDPARPAVSGVRFDDGVVVAQDGARLHTVAVAHSFGTFTLPCAGVVVLLEALDVESVVPKVTKGKGKTQTSSSPPSVRAAVGKNFITVETSTATSTRLVVCRKAPESYAQWRRVLEGLGEDGVVTVKRDVLLAALKCPADAMTLSWSAGGRYPGIGVASVDIPTTPFRLDYAVMDDTSTRRLGSGGAEVEAITQTGTVSVKVSVRCLLDAAKSCSDDVTLSSSPGQPLRVRCGGEGNYTFDAVVMWMR